MNTFYDIQITDDHPILRGKFMPKKLKKKLPNTRQDQFALIKKQSNALQKLHKNEGKLHIFSSQLTRLIDAIPDAVLLKDRDGRKLVTNRLTKSLFKLHDIDWYSKTDITSAFAHPEIHADHEHDHRTLKSELGLALEKRQFQLYYQIQVDGNCKMIGAEALLRWEHPQYGVLTADQFIPIAEQTDLILPIGAWVLKTACEQLRLWQADPLKKKLQLAVNISPGQFNSPGFAEQLRRTLEETGVNAKRLKLELTESLMLHDLSNTIKKMKALKQLGVRFSMDNFGTGYSSLSQLKKLPIDQLKIDPFLMRDIAIDTGDALIVKTVIAMTNKLEIDVIAGGVETEPQFACLKQLGCSAYQGYLFGKPIPLDEFEKLINPTDIAFRIK